MVCMFYYVLSSVEQRKCLKIVILLPILNFPFAIYRQNRTYTLRKILPNIFGEFFSRCFCCCCCLQKKSIYFEIWILWIILVLKRKNFWYSIDLLKTEPKKNKRFWRRFSVGLTSRNREGISFSIQENNGTTIPMMTCRCEKDILANCFVKSLLLLELLYL